MARLGQPVTQPRSSTMPTSLVWRQSKVDTAAVSCGFLSFRDGALASPAPSVG